MEETRSQSGTDSPVVPQDFKITKEKSINLLLQDVKIKIKDEDESLPKTINLSSSPVPAPGPSMIPLTVTEILDNDGLSGSGTSTLHMSGGGVYTTDSFLGKWFSFRSRWSCLHLHCCKRSFMTILLSVIVL